MVDERGSVIILKNNKPRYLVIDFSKVEDAQEADDKDIMAISKHLIEKNREAYEVLAQWKKEAGAALKGDENENQT